MNAEKQRAYRQRKATAEGRELGTVGRPAAAHGTASRYARGCRCEPCTKANTAKTANYRRRQRDHIE